MSDLIKITTSELSKVEDNMLNQEQLNFLLSKTPKNHIYQRPAKGGGKWSYVTGVYVKKVLNLMFGWDWSFEVVEYKFDLPIGQCFVLGKLTVNSNGKTIVKMQFGRVDIKFKKQNQVQKDAGEARQPLDIGNDLKAATTDALKKCASELGVASDVYAPNEFKEITVVNDLTPAEKKAEIRTLLDTEGLRINETDRMNYERILDQDETVSYDKAITALTKALPNEQ